jgi:hypothetical protein
MSMLSDMIERDRKRSGLTVAQAASGIGVTQRDYREIEARGARSVLRLVRADGRAVRLANVLRESPMNKRERWLAVVPTKVVDRREPPCTVWG